MTEFRTPADYPPVSTPPDTGMAAADRLDNPEPGHPLAASNTVTPARAQSIVGDAAAAGPAVVEPALVDGVNVDAVAAAVSACGGVSGMFAGRFGEIGTYLPGRRVPGVQVGDGTVTVHVRSRWGIPAARLLEEITAATAGRVAASAVHLVVADIDDPPGSAPAPPPEVRSPNASAPVPLPTQVPPPRPAAIGPPPAP